jgi:hypothetical protein
MNQGNDKNKFAKLIAKVWTDPAFKAKLQAKPVAAMAEMGLHVPENVHVEVLEDTYQKVHLVIPVKPSSQELTDEDLSNLTWAYASNGGPSGGSNVAHAPLK